MGISCFRTQTKNKEVCLRKLKEMIADAAIEPKERQQWEGIGDKGKSERRVLKENRRTVKEGRKKNNYSDYDF
jgi:hypothetical protein